MKGKTNVSIASWLGQTLQLLPGPALYCDSLLAWSSQHCTPVLLAYWKPGLLEGVWVGAPYKARHALCFRTHGSARLLGMPLAAECICGSFPLGGKGKVVPQRSNLGEALRIWTLGLPCPGVGCQSWEEQIVKHFLCSLKLLGLVLLKKKII